MSIKRLRRQRKNDMKINAVTLVRDSEKFIVPHLNMYRGVDRNIALFIPQKLNGGASGHSEERDGSLELIKKHCPTVEIHETQETQWGASIFNYAASLADDGGKTIMFHADVVLAPKDWDWMLNLMKTTDFDVYKLDMRRCTINYYNDFSRGVRDCLDVEPVAYRSDVRFSGIYNFPAEKKVHIIDDPSFTVHHFCGWKGIFAKKEWAENKIPSESGVYEKDLKPKSGWLSCPPEVKKLFV